MQFMTRASIQIAVSTRVPTNVLGMTPSRFRGGGTDTDIYFAIGQCSLGSILAAQSNKGVCSILIGDDPDVLVHDLEKQFPKANLIGNEAGL